MHSAGVIGAHRSDLFLKASTPTGNPGANVTRSLTMKRYLLAILLAGCTDKANIGMSDQPVKCQTAAAGVVNGTVTNTFTNKSYSFGTTAATLGGTSGTTGGNMIS